MQETYKEEGENDASEEEPTTNAEWNVDTTIGLVLGATVENGVRP